MQEGYYVKNFAITKFFGADEGAAMSEFDKSNIPCTMTHVSFHGEVIIRRKTLMDCKKMPKWSNRNDERDEETEYNVSSQNT